MRSLYVVVLTACLWATAAAAQSSLVGQWAGAWIREGDSLAVVLSFGAGPEGYHGSLGSEQLRATGIPLSRITHQQPRVHFEIVGDATTMVFDGRLAGDTLAGTFRDGDATGEFAVVRQDVSGPALREEEVTFHNGDVALGGTLVLPGTSGPSPAIIFVHGSGAEGRWASRFLANLFAESGFAALIFDKRGVGTSTGDWRTAGFDDLASDVRAGVALLRRHPSVDSLRVGIHGHSQGATIAPLIAGSAPEVAFVIASAAAGLPMDEVEIYSIENSVGMASLSPAEAADARSYVRALVDVAYHGSTPQRLDSLTTRFRGRPWFFEPPGPDSHYWKFSRRIVDFDPQAHWAKVRVPVLLMYGERDARVPVQPSISRITTALLADGDGSLTVRVLTGADHSFRIRSDGDGFAWPRNAPGYLHDLISWARWAALERTGR